MKINKIVNPVTATQNVCLCNNATPTRISQNIMNSTLTGPIDGTLPEEADTTSGTINKMNRRNILFEIL